MAGVGAIALAVLLIATVWIVRHRSAAQVLQTVAASVPGTLLHAHNFHWTQMKAGEREWVLTAGEADYSTDKTTEADQRGSHDDVERRQAGDRPGADARAGYEWKSCDARRI